MPVFKWIDLKPETIDPQHSSASGSVFRGEKIEVALVRHPAGTGVTAHASPHEQVQSILRGRARFRVGQEEREVAPGEAVLVSPDVEWTMQILEDLEVVAFRDAHPRKEAARVRGNQAAFIAWEGLKSDFITPRYSSARGPTLTGERIEVS
ncbi:MAG TPA: AraC family ligand binding domain-containing protein, partial [Candidatus Methylomirabilis sp.]|nr:AraC family ligand binding domain-containing protein [Candidatus Methylomirabilis sp.]